MKVGLIAEGLADIQVCQYFVKEIAPHIIISPITMVNKDFILDECGEQVVALIEEDGCDRVVIMWDLEPSWGQKRGCRKEDKERIEESLEKFVNQKYRDRVFLVCVENMLETWLIYDEKALISVLSSKNRSITRISIEKHPERNLNPKAFLINLYEQYRGKKYVDSQNAIEIAKRMKIKNLRKCDTFVRFIKKVTDIDLKTYQWS